MEKFIHQIRKCIKPNCGFRFPNYLSSEQYVYCPKCGSITEVIETPYESMVVHPSENQKDFGFEVLLDNIRSAYNVGSILRTSDGIGIDFIHFCGITPTPDHPKVSKTALDAEKLIPWSHNWDSIEVIKTKKESGFLIIALEGGENAMKLFDFIKETNNQPLLLVIGNEISGVDPGILQFCDHKVWLPMVGQKQSFNVSVAFGIAAYLIKYSELLRSSL